MLDIKFPKLIIDLLILVTMYYGALYRVFMSTGIEQLFVVFTRYVFAILVIFAFIGGLSEDYDGYAHYAILALYLICELVIVKDVLFMSYSSLRLGAQAITVLCTSYGVFWEATRWYAQNSSFENERISARISEIIEMKASFEKSLHGDIYPSIFHLRYYVIRIARFRFFSVPLVALLLLAIAAGINSGLKAELPQPNNAFIYSKFSKGKCLSYLEKQITGFTELT